MLRRDLFDLFRFFPGPSSCVGRRVPKVHLQRVRPTKGDKQQFDGHPFQELWFQLLQQDRMQKRFQMTRSNDVTTIDDRELVQYMEMLFSHHHTISTQINQTPLTPVDGFTRSMASPGRDLG